MSNQSFKKAKTYSRDEILAFTDKELHSAANQVRSCIRDARRRGEDTTSLEIEFCYLDNERQKREKWGFASPSKKKDTYNSSSKEKYPGRSRSAQPVKPRDVRR